MLKQGRQHRVGSFGWAAQSEIAVHSLQSVHGRHKPTDVPGGCISDLYPAMLRSTNGCSSKDVVREAHKQPQPASLAKLHQFKQQKPERATAEIQVRGICYAEETLRRRFLLLP